MLGKKTRSLGQILKNYVGTLEGIVLVQSALNFVKMFVTMKFLTCLKLDHVGSKSRLLDQVLEKPFLHFKDLKVLSH